MKLISIVTACYNEEDNIQEIYHQIKNIFSELMQYHYEHIFIDNSSTDKTVDILKSIAQQDKNIKLIVNTRNFGHIRSPMHAILQAKGDAVISIAADLQEPPELIKNFLMEWELGFKIVVGVKKKTCERFPMRWIRNTYYHLATTISNTPLIKNFTGFGLYDRKVIDAIKELNDPYPYFRGLISEIGYSIKEIPYTQPLRERGITKNNLYTLYDMAILGITSHSKIPIRLATFFGFLFSVLSFCFAILYLILKLLYWGSFKLGIAPLLIGFFFFSSVQLFFIGILGEYIAAIHTQALNRPLVFEKERINFD